ncbi:molybdopterin biosynthesis MoeB protein [Nitzschia inconspicua]|uniref:Adenylyltransferase and sulfurtransferase MOCS3 homolog n=1 Tax=Nitzschia inconspicua TaxID=303405 RepID=A0A9K3LAF0_9STRA|nr:molybdopterin biosynthesis MoeB protein [Nitzschia inconspicua]
MDTAAPLTTTQQLLEERIRQLEEENAILRAKLEHATQTKGNFSSFIQANENSSLPVSTLSDTAASAAVSYEGILNPTQIERYSRQLLLQGGFGVQGQVKLQNSKVLIVGAGGIGSTVIFYLAACGVGHLSIVDFDDVDVSNLHRQVIHKNQDVGMNKAESARRAVHDLNPTISCSTIQEPLTDFNALELIQTHDCVVDASDNPQTRYLINDACVLSGKPLVSGSAMGMEGQLTVYNFREGSCYRCLYPKPNATEGSKSCADNGVLGPVPGLIGVLQAVETIKVLTGVGEVMSDRLLMYDASQCSFVRIKKPPKQPQCPACSGTIRSMKDSYQASQSARGPSCSVQRQAPEVSPQHETSVQEYHQIRQRDEPHILLDVRVHEQFDLCRLPGAINIPLSSLTQQHLQLVNLVPANLPIYCVCRRGIASAMAVNKILQEGIGFDPSAVHHIVGGLDAWRSQIDKSFPQY